MKPKKLEEESVLKLDEEPLILEEVHEEKKFQKKKKKKKKTKFLQLQEKWQMKQKLI